MNRIKLVLKEQIKDLEKRKELVMLKSTAYALEVAIKELNNILHFVNLCIKKDSIGDLNEISQCKSCHCMTKIIKGKCGKCKYDKGGQNKIDLFKIYDSFPYEMDTYEDELKVQHMIIHTIKELKKLERKFIKEKMKLIEYAYLCDECCTILECPCFKDGKCPECGSESKKILYLKSDKEGK